MPSVITGTSLSSAALTTGAAGNPGSVTGTWTLTAGSSWEATFADLAEYHTSDQEYEYGTVLIFGGERELTICDKFADTRVAGVVSKDPAYIMNAGQPGITVKLALQGRTPVKISGQVRKGDLLVSSANPGFAEVVPEARPGTLIGKSLEDKFTEEDGFVMAAIGRF
jgi:hypothetical protein